MNIHDDFEEFLLLLNSEKTDFVIIGGYAVAYHGYIRTTQDIDIYFRNSSENVANILKALIKFDFPEDSLDPKLFTESGSIVRIGVPPARIKLLNKISGVSFDEVWGNRIFGKYGKVELNRLRRGFFIATIGKIELKALLRTSFP